MPGQAYHKKSMCIDGAEKKSLAHHRQVSCSSLYSLYDENDVPSEIKNITSMQNPERYPPRRARAEKRVTEIFSKESRADTAPRQKRLKPKLEPPKPGTEMNQRYLSSPVSGKQSAMYEKSIIATPSNANKSAQRPAREYQSTINIGDTKNRLLATQTTPMPLIGTIGPFTDTTKADHGTYLGTDQARELAKIEPASAQPRTKLPRLVPVTAQSNIRFPRQNEPTVASSSMNADSGSTKIGSSSMSSPVNLFTASFAASHDLEFSTPTPFIRGVSQPFPSSGALGSYPQYPYNENLNHLADGHAGTSHPGFNPQTEYIGRSVLGGDMVTYVTKNTHDDDGRMDRNPYFDDVMKSMRPKDMGPIWKEKQEGMKVRKKVISKSMISAPIGLVVKDERRVVSEVIIQKDSPSKGKVWSKVLKMMV